jgi:gliding motility-associated-like protein
MKLFSKTGNIILCAAQCLLFYILSIPVSAQSCNDSVKVSSSPINICVGSTVTFTATVPAGATNPNFQWQYNGAFVGFNSNSYTTNSLNAGDVMKCTLTATDCKGTPFTSKDSIIISVNPVSKPSISISTDASYICKGSNVIFTAAVLNCGSNPIYQWKINGINAGTNSSSFSTSSLNDGDVVNCSLTADPLLPCAVPKTASSYGISMTVSNAAAPSVSITSSANNVCPGTLVTFTAVPQNASSSTSYQWKLNNTNIGNDSTNYSSNTLANNDEIYCVLTDSSGCSRSPVPSEKIVMIIESLPEITINPLDTSVAPGSQVRLNAFISGDVSSYQWQPSQDLNNTSSLSPVTQPLLASTNYFLNVITNDGCSTSKEITIKILGDVIMPNAFTPNGDGHNDVFRIPANTNINLREFSIYNRLGNKVFSTTDAGKGWDGNINGVKQGSGMYVYVITTKGANGKVFYKGSFLLIR